MIILHFQLHASCYTKGDITLIFTNSCSPKQVTPSSLTSLFACAEPLMLQLECNTTGLMIWQSARQQTCCKSGRDRVNQLANKQFGTTASKPSDSLSSARCWFCLRHMSSFSVALLFRHSEFSRFNSYLEVTLGCPRVCKVP